MSRQLIPFTFEGAQVRTVQDSEGRVLFAGRDVATILGYRDATNAIKQHCRGVAIHHPIVDSLGRTQEARFITEGDLYRLIASSKLPSAQAFETWVFDDVLPSIRRRGGYLTPEATEKALTDPDFIIKLATSLKEERAHRQQLEAQAEANRPKIVFADAVTAAKTTILVGELAKLLKQNGIDIGGTRLFAWMRRNGFLISRKGSDYNQPTQRAMDAGLFEVKETAITHSDGHVTVSRTPKVTGKGQAYFVTRFLDGRFTVDQGEVVLA